MLEVEAADEKLLLELDLLLEEEYSGDEAVAGESGGVSDAFR